jgi:hypothetical protein
VDSTDLRLVAVLHLHDVGDFSPTTTAAFEQHLATHPHRLLLQNTRLTLDANLLTPLAEVLTDKRAAPAHRPARRPERSDGTHRLSDR